MVPRFVSALIILSAAGCSNRTVLENEGGVCAFSQAGAQDWRAQQAFTANTPIHLLYSANTCLSSSCDTDREASCSVRLEGSVLIVESHAEWTSHGGATSCTADCGNLSAACEVPPLAEGTYTIQHGSQQVLLTIPSEPAQAPCTADPMW